jgi:hypothetical protein
LPDFFLVGTSNISARPENHLDLETDQLIIRPAGDFLVKDARFTGLNTILRTPWTKVSQEREDFSPSGLTSGEVAL